MKIDRRLLKKSYIYTFILGFVTHGYFFANFMLSHDALNNLFIAGDWSKANFGRIFYHVYMVLSRGRIVFPWLIGILAMCWCSLAVYLILQLFEIEKDIHIFLISAICITNPTVYALTATYIHDLDADLFAMLLAVYSVVLWNKAMEEVNKKIRYGLLAAGAVILSIVLGIYQSYISVAIALIMILSIKRLLEQEEFQTVFIHGLHGIAMLGASAILYLSEIKIFSSLTGISIMDNQDYNGLGNMSTVFSEGLLNGVLHAYMDFFMSFKNLVSSYPGRTYLIIHMILAICIIVIVLYGLFKLNWKSKILVIVLGLLMPLGMNVSCALSSGTIHDIMRYAFWFVYVLAFILLLWILKESAVTNKTKKLLHGIVMISLLLVISGNIQTANTIYVKKDLEYQSTLSYMTRVVERMEQQDGYIPSETPVVIVGENAIGITRYGFEPYTNITGAELTSPITFYGTYEQYFEYVLGTPILLSSNEDIANGIIVEDMPVFPKEGSVKMIDDTLVVKLGD